MDQTGENKYSLEPAKQAAAEAGKQRLDKLMRFLYTVAGADVLVTKSAEVGKQLATDKATELKDRAVAFRDKVVEKAVGIKNDLIEEGNRAAAGVAEAVNTTAHRMEDKATELTKRAEISGLKPAAWMQEKYAQAYQIPAKIREVIAGRYETRASAAELRAAQEVQDYQAMLKTLQEQHAVKIALLGEARTEALHTAGEHKQKAVDRRQKAAQMTSVKDRIARIQATL